MDKYLVGGIIAGFSFGTAAIFIRALGEFPSTSIAFWRLIIGGSILALTTYILRLEEEVRFSELKLASIMGLLLALHFILFIQSVKDTSVINATTLVNTAPIQAVLVSILMFKTTPSKLSLLSVLLGFVGAAIMGGGRFQPHTIGDIEALTAGTLLAVYANVGKLARGGLNVRSLPFMYKVYFIAGLVVFFISTFLGELTMPTCLNETLLLVGLGLIPTGAGHTLIVYSLKRLKAYEAETLALIEPISASTLAYLIFGETPSTASLVGFSFVGFSIILLSISLVRSSD